MKKIIKLLNYILFLYPLFFISKLIKRNNNLWVIGSKNNFSCNSKYFYLNFYSKNNYSNITLIWITPNKKLYMKLKSKGYKVAYKYSIKGLYYLLKSRVYITSYGSQYDLSYWTSGGVFLVYLWHGIGIKNINYSSTTPVMLKIYHSKKIIDIIAYSSYREKPNLFISTSDFMNQHFSKAFNIPLCNIITSIYPRCSIFNMSNQKIIQSLELLELHQEIYLFKKSKEYKNTIFYMPTWRDNNSNFMELAIPNYTMLNDTLKKTNSLFIIKLHPNTNIAEFKKDYSNIIIIKGDIDPYPILAITDLLITDYSSIYYDYILKDVYRTLLYPFDIISYTQECRDLAYPYDEYTEGEKAYTYNELLFYLSNIEKNITPNNSNRIKDIFLQPSKQKIDIIPKIIEEIED
ncbi:CDP-glycerol glycerophosphotransferase family protein [Morganella morganii]|uniref:CDP-glycerol glycerophosphotransferase family protein n=1 Tax=Morganella morganii TaxID=582 RepID=UPI003EBC5944